VGAVLILVAIGAGISGYMLGRFHGESPSSAHFVTTHSRPAAAPDAPPPVDPFDQLEEVEVMPVPDASRASSGETPVTPSELLEALRRNAGTERGQQILIGMVADAARVGSPMMPEIERLLREGVDIEFPSFDGKTGYPSLRVALLAAAEATGDPAAKDLIAEVARTSESPVEVVFSAHMLDRLDALDRETAQRTIDSLAADLTPEQKKAMASVLRQVIPAAAKVDPDYAEHFLATQIRLTGLTGGKGADMRMLAPLLDGLPAASARNMVLNTITAPDVPDRTKRVMAQRAAQRNDLEVISGLRHAIESNALDPRVSSSIARGVTSARPYSKMYKSARIAVKKGNLRHAQRIANDYQARLDEANLTIQAARTAGARLPPDIQTHAILYKQRLDKILEALRVAHRKLEAQRAKEQR